MINERKSNASDILLGLAVIGENVSPQRNVASAENSLRLLVEHEEAVKSALRHTNPDTAEQRIDVLYNSLVTRSQCSIDKF